MYDIEFANFYNQIKDPSWPMISQYHEFFNLPGFIQQESWNQHGLDARLAEIGDASYWINQGLEVIRYDNLLYFPLPKCASTYYLHHFKRAGWQRQKISDIDLDGKILFGLLMHPLKRYLKGITQQIVNSFSEKLSDLETSGLWQTEYGPPDWPEINKAMQSKYFRQFVQDTNIGDAHSMPYYILAGKYVNLVTWIPFDIFPDSQVQVMIEKLISPHLPNKIEFVQHRLHESSLEQNHLFEQVKTLFFSNKHQIYTFYKFFAPDLRLYHNAVKKFSLQTDKG